LAESLFIAVALIIPSATVAERIEARWLFAPLVFIVLALIILPSEMYWPAKVGQFMVLVLFIVSNYSNQNSYQEFDFWRIRTINVIDAVVKESDNMPGEWDLVITWLKSDAGHSLLPWSLGNGEVFSELKNKPNKIWLGSRSSIFSGNSELLKNPNPCLVVKIADFGNYKNDIRKVEFQAIQTSTQVFLSDSNVDPQRG
jgi:hypothetical protein